MNDQVTTHRSVEELEAFLQAMPDLLFIQDKNGVYVDYHASDLSLLFVKPEQFLGKSMNEVLPAPVASSLSDAFAQALTTRKPQTAEYALTLAAGELFFEARISLYGEDKIMTIVRDMTQLKKKELELRKFIRIIEQSSATIVITDRNGVIEYVNPAFERITGYTKKEAIGKNPKILKSDHTTKEIYEALWSTILAGNTWKGEFLNKSKSGALYWENVIISPIFDEKGTITNFLAIKDDVTAHKRIEQEKLTGDEILKRLVSNLPGFIYRCLNDADWTVTYMSDGVIPILGYLPSEFIDKKISYGSFIAEPDKQVVWDTIQDAIQKHEAYELRYRVTAKNGGIHWVWERGRGIYDDKGALQYLEGFITDVTDQKEAEETLQTRTRELEAMNGLMIGRELKMRELKHTIETLSKNEKGGTV